MAITQAFPNVQNGAMITAKGTRTFLNITSSTLIKATPGRVARVSVLHVSNAGSQPATVCDSATLAGAATANIVAFIPDTVGVYEIDMPFGNGIVLAVGGAGQRLAISYN